MATKKPTKMRSKRKLATAKPKKSIKTATTRRALRTKPPAPVPWG